MIRVKIDRAKIEDWCDNLSECCSFLKRFFVPARERQDYNKTLMLYMQSLEQGMKDEKYAKMFQMSSEEFKFFHNELMDAFHDIVSLHYEHKPGSYY
ncbi:hypothetical protein D6777_01190 [Candidatus Woesearchaeota archaeon]|nr:MAG: hypothetical protein D6777_01190 [Candidatus Woesearchaeota archaeon]